MKFLKLFRTWFNPFFYFSYYFKEVSQRYERVGVPGNSLSIRWGHFHNSRLAQHYTLDHFHFLLPRQQQGLLTGSKIDLYSKYKSKFEKEAEELHKEMKQNKIELSKLEDYIAYSLMCCCNLSEMWHSGDYIQRQELQNALFEGGIVYNREKDECLGLQVNEFVCVVVHLSGSLAILGPGNKKNRPNFTAPISGGVAKERSLKSI
jgi:hypothetical protein